MSNKNLKVVDESNINEIKDDPKNTSEPIDTKNVSVDEDKEKIYIPKGKIFLHLWFMYKLMRKSKKMASVIKTDPNRYTEQYRYTWLRKKALKILRILNIRVNVFGIENWLDEGVLLTPNHKSNFDPLILLALNDFDTQQVIAFIAKQELWSSKMGRFASIIDAIPLDRNNPRSAHEAFQAAKKLIVNYRRAMVVFPEGTRHMDDEIHDFIPTSLRLAQMANVPVVPVTIINSNSLTEKTKSEKVITIVFDKPIRNEKHIIMKPEMLTNIVQRKVVENYDKYKNLDVSNLTHTKKQKRNKIYYYDLV